MHCATAKRNRKAQSRFKTAVVHALRKSGFTINDDEVRAQDENRYFSTDLQYGKDVLLYSRNSIALHQRMPCNQARH
jgi:hypothetical protein